jgi:hypothetical protein
VPPAANRDPTTNESADKIQAAGSVINKRGHGVEEDLEIDCEMAEGINPLTAEEEAAKEKDHVNAEVLEDPDGNGERRVEFES